MDVEDGKSPLEILWKVSFPLRTPRPEWSGYMQMVNQGAHPGKSSVHFMPMIDLDPGDPNCIYSTLYFVCCQAKKQHMTPVVTFDQPLWWKAVGIVKEEPKNSCMSSVVLRLGGLHLQMSFLGAIGHLMSGSGLEEILELIYAENAVTHMVSGKAIVRAVRGHSIVDAALNTLMVCDISDIALPLNVPEEDSQELPEDINQNDENLQPTMPKDLQNAGDLYDELMSDASKADEVCTSESIQTITEKLKQKKESLQESRTAKLWVEYMKMVDILRTFIKAERTGDWKLHLQAVYDMLPYFAASGHNLYTKSAYLYLQMMQDLENTHPDVHQKFMEGYHVIRRSDRYWAGLSSDLIIEQVLMRSVKTSGGLTRGRGVGEIQHLVWLLSMPARAEMHNAMLDLTGVQHTPSEQHKEVSKSRQKRDVTDTTTVLRFLAYHNPFSDDLSLRNLANGLTASSKVNVDQAKEIGDKIIKSIVGKTTQNLTFKRKNQAVNLKHDTSTVEINDEIVSIDPQLLFQRLIAVRDKVDDTVGLFKYELCSYPAALFEPSLLPREATKSELADALWDMVGENQEGPSDDVQYVIDGGAFLQRIPWTRGQTYDSILDSYCDFISKYGKAIVVFDGYESGPSTKDATHQRRAAGCVGMTVNFTPDMVLTVKKDVFLSNTSNKQKFIHLLGQKLESVGCTVHHATADADLHIAVKAVESARMTPTAVIGDDTDLLILLCYHGELFSKPLFFMPEPKKRSKKPRRIWNINQTKEQLGPIVCKHILFIHAVSGCDTTSRLFGIGKGQALKTYCSSELFQEQAHVFDTNDGNKEEIVSAGEKAVICLYKSKNEGLDDLRHKKFCQKVATSSSPVQASSIPPTSAACHYHSLRVYHQVQQWKGQDLNPCNWGWKIQSGKCVAIRTDLAAAPKTLLEIVKCNCKTGCKTGRCTCKKHGLECTAVCGECKGVSCENGQQLDLSEDDNDDAE